VIRMAACTSCITHLWGVAGPSPSSVPLIAMTTECDEYEASEELGADDEEEQPDQASGQYGHHGTRPLGGENRNGSAIGGSGDGL
jgi:hypothetical protein